MNTGMYETNRSILFVIFNNECAFFFKFFFPSREHGENRAFNFNTGLASAHSYLGGRHIPSTGVCSRGLKSVSYAKLEAKLYGHFYLTEVEDTQGRLSLLEGGAVVDLPLLFLEGNFSLLHLNLKLYNQSHCFFVLVLMVIILHSRTL